MFRAAGTCPCGNGGVQLASAGVAAVGAVGPIDTRLVAAVQCRAGARVHEAANLVQAYFNLAEAHKRAARRNDPAAAEAAGRQVRAAVVNLRRFLARSVSGIQASLGAHVDRNPNRLAWQ